MSKAGVLRVVASRQSSSAPVHYSLGSLCELLISDELAPFDVLAVLHVGNRDVAHAGLVGCPVPMVHATGIQTTSPGLISRFALPSCCTHPLPEVTIRIWPAGCVCQAVRAPGAKVT